MKIFLVIPVLILISLSSVSVGTISTASNPSYGVYYNGKIYFIAQGAGELQILDNNNIVSTINLPNYPNPFRITILNGDIYIVYQNGPLIELENGKVIWNYTIPQVGKYPAIISAGNYVVVTASYGDEVYFITPNHQVNTVTVMSSPQALAYDNYTNVVYVGAYGSPLIYGISLNNFKVVQNITLNVSSVEAMTFIPPNELAVSPGHHYFEIINLTNGKVVAFDSLPYTLGAINGYAWICYIPYDNDIVLSIPHDSDTVVVFNNKGGLVEEVNVGSDPNGIVYDPQNHYIYVINYGSSTISYFQAPPPNVTTKPIPKTNYTPYFIATGVVAIILVIVGLILFVRRR
ncbi:hypothetical protein [Sulfurisphaera ohwakuensis]|uniref:DNA-binding beta-propeller fold protein YncE n=1 Tax=Sulfurisphaera ohwakuensis TaxID=69656 RepID=A0A650CFP3_SULOH|nr:hypothetical protein [Sulfurisphaera ohwakuensis]MBB5255135.1 DNA-binding beta-propeller fold protein YncE [Sulfurisphaera ohwakuensis]QGR16612.1 hypothetical protein D1869_04940 [Sulfurisphaera ohwakuensis]